MNAFFHFVVFLCMDFAMREFKCAKVGENHRFIKLIL